MAAIGAVDVVGDGHGSCDLTRSIQRGAWMTEGAKCTRTGICTVILQWPGIGHQWVNVHAKQGVRRAR